MLGVRIILAYRARLPKWIREKLKYASRFSVERMPTGTKKTYRVLEIDGGDARFFPGGVVDIQVPGTEGFKTAFGPMRVMRIVPHPGKCMDNYYFCRDCYDLTGERLGKVPGDYRGKVHIDMRCTRCGRKWRILNA